MDFKIIENGVVVEEDGFHIFVPKHMLDMLLNTMKVRLIGKIMNRKNGFSPTTVRLNFSDVILSLLYLT